MTLSFLFFFRKILQIIVAHATRVSFLGRSISFRFLIKPSNNNKGKEFSQKNAQQQNDNPEKDSPGSITKKQIGMIRYNLKERSIPEKAFCSSHDIAHIENLSLNEARAIIMNEDF